MKQKKLSSFKLKRSEWKKAWTLYDRPKLFIVHFCPVYHAKSYSFNKSGGASAFFEIMLVAYTNLIMRNSYIAE